METPAGDVDVVRPDRFVFGAAPLARLPELRTALGMATA
jgi:3-(3-hydroxy-phenyl)propionate hydroxylase